MQEITVTRCGVAKIEAYNGELRVNDMDMIQLAQDALDALEMQPVRDYNGNFAARITVTVELMGDEEPKKETST